MKNIVNLLNEKIDLEFKAWGHKDIYTGESARLFPKEDSDQLGFSIEKLAAKKFSCPYHFHHKEQELFYVIMGNAYLRQDDEFSEVKAGDLIYFKTGTAHQFYNHSEESFVFLAVSNIDSKDICEYPDSKKVLNRESKTLQIEGQEINDYWQGEEAPWVFWPEEIVGKR